MMGLIKGFIKEEDGMSTVEIVIIIAVLVGLAILFRGYIMEFARALFAKVFPSDGGVDDPWTSPAP